MNKKTIGKIFIGISVAVLLLSAFYFIYKDRIQEELDYQFTKSMAQLGNNTVFAKEFIPAGSVIRADQLTSICEEHGGPHEDICIEMVAGKRALSDLRAGTRIQMGNFSRLRPTK